MNEIKVTVELSAEDRGRLDKIIGLMEARDIQAQTVIDEEYGKPTDDINAMLKKAINPDPVEPEENAQEKPKASDHPTLDPFPEVAKAATEPSEAAKELPSVSTAELQQLVIAICRAGKKDKVREIVSTYGVPTVAAIPEDKRSEAYAELKKLEG